MVVTSYDSPKLSIVNEVSEKRKLWPSRIKPRLVYLYGQSLPNKAANSGAVADLCRALNDIGYRTTWAYVGKERDEDAVRRTYRLPDSLRCIRLKEIGGSLRYPGLAAFSLAKVRADVTITRMPQAAIVTALLGRPTILELHQHLNTYRHWTWWRRFLHLLPKGRLSVAALTPSIVEQMDPLLKVRVRKIAVIPSAASDLLDGDASSIYDVGYVGSFMPGKGIERIVHLATSLPDVSFVIYGDPSGDPEAAAKFATLGNVTLAGFVERARIANALGTFRIGIAPYAKDGFGRRGSAFVSMDSMSSLKVLEYMSASRAVVATRIPTIANVIDHGETGLLCAADDADAWVAAVRLLKDEPRLSKRLARNARRVFEEKHSYARRASAFAELVTDFGH